jgi:malic enzyme
LDKIVEAVTLIAPSFGGINLEDISGPPRCFETVAQAAIESGVARI